MLTRTMLTRFGGFVGFLVANHCKTNFNEVWRYLSPTGDANKTSFAPCDKLTKLRRNMNYRLINEAEYKKLDGVIDTLADIWKIK